MKKALITGITGQDGSYLTELLLKKNYKIYGLIRRTSNDPLIRINSPSKINFIYGNMRDIASIERAISESMPDEVYNLAAQSDVGISFKAPEETWEINYHGVGRLFNAILRIKPEAKIYQASTSEMFGESKPPQNESSLFSPVSPYAKAKLKAHEDYVVGYREKHNLFACSGLLFNHESPFRGEHFVTRKITISLARIKLGLQDYFELGNLDAKRDWGFAGDYVKAMWKILQQEKPEDFVISTGRSHTVRDFVKATAKSLNMSLKWEGSGINERAIDNQGKVILKINKKFYRPTEVNFLQGDNTKAKKILNWKPKTSFEDLVHIMANSDFEQQKKLMK